MSETTLRRSLPEAYTIGLVGADNYWAFLNGGAGVICAAYKDGTYIVDVAETSDAPGLSNCRATLAEERYLLLNPTDGSALYVWDVQTNTVASYAAPTGYQVAGAGAIDGVVYWIEWPELDWDGGPLPTPYTSTVRLMSAGYDLATPATVGTTIISAEFHWEWKAGVPTAWFAVNSDAVLAERVAVDAVNHEVTSAFRVRAPLSGADGSSSGGGSFASIAGRKLGVPKPAGGSLFPGTSGGEPGEAAAVLFLEDDVAPENVLVSDWPEVEPWTLAFGAVNVSVIPASDEVMAYGLGDAGAAVVRGDIGASSGSPRKHFTVDDHPTELSPPDYMFPRSA